MLHIDVDVVCKLAHWGILPLLPSLTHRPWNDMGTMASLKYRALRAVDRPDGKLFHTVDAAMVVVDCLAEMKPLPEPNPELLAHFADSEQIDSGEAILFALTIDDPEGYFLTGDKRALRAVSQLQVAFQMCGRVMIIEQILWRCLLQEGREWMLKHVCPFRHIDKSISMILGSQCDGNEAMIIEGIGSYIREIRMLHSPSLLVDDAEFL